MSNEGFINALSAGLTPVRRRSVRRETLVLAALGALELALFVAVASTRADMTNAITHPLMWWKLGGLTLLVGISVFTALRSLSPGAFPRRGLVLIGSTAGLIAAIGAFINPGIATDMPMLNRLAPMHGLTCTACIIALSVPMLAVLAVFMRRGASTHPEATALAIGIGSGSWGALVFALRCPMNDPLYILLWYCVACATVTVLARLVLPRITHL